jgi:hypothetical protein
MAVGMVTLDCKPGPGIPPPVVMVEILMSWPGC